MWTPADDLACDTASCEEVLGDLGSRSKTLNAARAKGWHLFDGTTMGGNDLERHVCSACMGTSNRLPKIKNFDDEQTLW